VDVGLHALRLKALGHPIRLGIALHLALEPDSCVSGFSDEFDVSQPTVSQHLKVLREAQLVTTFRRGTQICYSLDPSALDDLKELLGRLQPPPARLAAV
jgi:ArsR family transcriptional regulator, arsenate/arsenite/antimonite-responsive transcriptional repressor